MNYLEYIRDGVIKTYDLDFRSGKVIIGRAASCDVLIDSPYISKRHLEISLYEKKFKLVQLTDKNPIIINDSETDFALIGHNENFRIADIDFKIKKKETKTIIYNIGSNIEEDSSDSKEYKTKRHREKFDSNKLFSFDIQDKLTDPTYIFYSGAKMIKSVFNKGSFLIIESVADKHKMVAELNMDNSKYHLHSDMDLSILFSTKKKSIIIKKHIFFVFKLLELKSKKLSLIYYREGKKKLDELNLKFISEFITEFRSIYREYNSVEKTYKSNKLPIITNNAELLSKLRQLKSIAKNNLKILIEGETGVGKELVSRFIFNNFKTNKNKYIAINCSTLPVNLIEAELFGYEKGAFTDAKSQKKGKIEEAHNGTLVLDEIGELPLEAQAKLLRALQEKTINRIGSNIDIRVNFNLISMTNKNLKKMVKEGKFREDLFFRIAEFLTHIPPLRERKEDIFPLIKHFIESSRKNNGGYNLSFTENALRLLENYSWLGNVRELENMIKILISISDPGELITDTALKRIFESKFDDLEKNSSINKEYLIEVLKNNFWNKTKAANYLNISRTELYRKMKKYGIN